VLNLQWAEESEVMQTGVQTAAVSRTSMWIGRVVSAIPVLMLLFSGSVELLKLPSVVQGFGQNGYPAGILLTQRAWTSPSFPDVCRAFWTSACATI